MEAKDPKARASPESCVTQRLLCQLTRAKMEKRWVTVREASRYLGIHPVTCRRLIDRGLIPFAKIGRSVRIDLRKLNEQLEREMNSNGKVESRKQ